MKLLAAIVASLALVWTTAQAQNISGIWQADGKPQRVLKITKDAKTYHGELYNLGEDVSGVPLNGNGISTITLTGHAVSFSPDEAQGSFDGKLSDDGDSITGTWKMLYRTPQPLIFTRATKQTAWVIDPSPHKSLFITVQPGVKLEVLDFGGGSGGSSGPVLIFLSGLGGTGHSFDSFAPKFTNKHHVYAITRRGFGASSSPPDSDANYDSDRLGDDVLAVMDALHIEKPVIAGHSIAGEELSSIGTRHPGKVAGLIYLDALNQFSFYDPSVADLSVEVSTVKRDLSRMFDMQNDPAGMRALIADVQSALPNLQKALSDAAEATASMKPALDQPQKPEDLAGNRIFDNTRKYGPVKVPVLTILAEPRQCGSNCDKPFMQKILADAAARSANFEKQNPSARVVRIAKASHYIWRSNADEVLREMNVFMDQLRKP
ncbi:MAG TPA: alpha/beta hydrolase [Rhizomicrobium sp.]|nr:alpha/beta hydrolase [Rhizomicrobium sp.]